MNSKDIEVFLELVRCRNITKTAENLFISQSAVSNRLQNLEQQLGTQLILRAKGRRSVELTRAGREFIPVAERWRALYEETEWIGSLALSTIRIATNESTYDRLLAPFLQRYIRDNPDKKVHIKICDSDEVYDLVSKDLVDFGFAAHESTLGGVLVRCIDEQPLCIVRRCAAPQPPMLIHPSELDPDKEIQAVGGNFTCISRWRERWFGRRRLCRIEINTSSGVLSLLNDTQQWVMLPLASALHHAQSESLQICMLEEPPEPWCIYMLRSVRGQSQALEFCRRFEEELLAFLDEMRARE